MFAGPRKLHLLDDSLIQVHMRVWMVDTAQLIFLAHWLRVSSYLY